MQFISFTGHLTAGPTARATNNGTSVTSFTVGVTRSHRNQNGDRESDFFRVTAWRQQAEFCSKYLTKGMKVFVRGELQPSIFEGKDGKARLSLDVQADAVEILSEKQKEQKKELEGFTDISSDDLPFGR